jgi:hypothetical protein
MLERVEYKEIKILLMISLFVAFGCTGLFGLAFSAGCLLGDMLVDILD